MTVQERSTWRSGRTIAGVLGLVFSGLYLFEGQKLPMGAMDAPGPGIFPLAVGVLSLLVSLGVIADARLTKDPGSATFPKGPDARRLGLIFAAFVLYVASLSLLGLPVATTLFVAFYVRTVGKISWIWSGISGVGVALAIWAVFELLLAVRLPTPVWS